MPLVKRNPRFEREQREWVKGKVCDWCGRPATTAHHTKPVGIFPELEMVKELWQPVCNGECHLRLSHSGDFRAYNPHAFKDAKKQQRRRKERKYTR